MRSPINATMGLHLANSMIQGTDIAKAIMAKRALRKKQQAMNLQEQPSSLSSTLTSTDHSSTSGSTAAVSDTTNNGQYKQGEEQPEGETVMLLGSGYWKGFM
jgi:hypothetical protein